MFNVGSPNAHGSCWRVPNAAWFRNSGLKIAPSIHRVSNSTTQLVPVTLIGRASVATILKRVWFKLC